MKKISKLKKWWQEKNNEWTSSDIVVNETTEEITGLFQSNIHPTQKANPGLRRLKTRNILNYLRAHKISELLIYVFEEQIFRILEYGILPLNAWNNEQNDSEERHTFLQHRHFTELELSNSSRAVFWDWITRHNYDARDIAFISIDIDKLVKHTNKNWQFNEVNKRIIITEPIPVATIKWIFVKRYTNLQRISRQIQDNNLEIKLYHGEEGTAVEV